MLRTYLYLLVVFNEKSETKQQHQEGSKKETLAGNKPFHKVKSVQNQEDQKVG